MTVEKDKACTVSQIIEYKAKKLKKSPLFLDESLESLQHEMHVHVHRKMPSYHPMIGLERFVNTILRSYSIDLCRRRLAQKRNAGRKIHSLDDKIIDGTSRETKVQDLVVSDFHTHQHQAELRIAFNDVRERLKSDEACQVLQEMLDGYAEYAISQRTGISRRKVKRYWKLIVLMLEDAGLGREGSAQNP